MPSISPRYRYQTFRLFQEGTVYDSANGATPADTFPFSETLFQTSYERAQWGPLQDVSIPPGGLAAPPAFRYDVPTYPNYYRETQFTIRRDGDQVPLRITWDVVIRYSIDNSIYGTVPFEITLDAAADTSSVVTIPAPALVDSYVTLENAICYAPWR